VEEILSTVLLSKRYGKRFAVRDVSITVRRGEIYGFLGQNGAGKSTTIRMLVGLARPTTGTVRLLGKEVRFGEYRHLERIGCIVETPGFYPNLTARENLDIHRRLMRVSDRASVDRALELLGIEVSRQKVGSFSTGMRQRLGIARALLHEPELLILDEPVNGLDPLGIKEVRRLLADLARERKVTVFLSSHILGEIEKLADRIGIIHHGRVIREMGLDEIEAMNRQYIELSVSDASKACFILEQRLGIRRYEVTEPGVVRVYEKLEQGQDINRELVTAGVEVREMKLLKDSLEDYFLRMTGGET
jgi:bacitracin transport system ATP-binding protein